MRKNIAVLIIILAASLIIGRTLVLKPTISPTSSQITPTATGAMNKNSCSPDQLQVSMRLEPAAGNVYGSITLSNISPKPCDIQIGQKIETSVPQSVKNFTPSYQGTQENKSITLGSGQSIYSRLHYPNGPQCSSGVVSTPVTLTYTLSNGQTLTLTDKNNSQVKVATCENPVDMTTLDLWYFSTQPIVR